MVQSVSWFLTFCSRLPSYIVPKDIQIAIGDGLYMGRRRCQAAHCTIELGSNRHRFCPTHMHLDAVCSIVDCDAAAVPGKKACNDPQHVEVERLHYERGRAAFTLRDRLHKHRLAHLNDQVLEPTAEEGNDGEEENDGDEEWFVLEEGGEVRIQRNDNPGSIGVDDEILCEASKAGPGTRKCKALFSGARTHNEQILCRPCGVILSRATFYHAEAVSNVLVCPPSCIPLLCIHGQ